MSEAERKRKKDLIDREVCPNHKDSRVVPGKKSCQICLNDAKSRSALNSRNGMCKGHKDRPVVPGKKFCQACLDAAKAVAATNNARGMCQGHKNNPVVPGKTLCQVCLDRRKARTVSDSAKGMCTGHPKCPVAPGKTVCQVCLDRASVRAALNSGRGMCRGHKNNCVIPGTTYCQECLDQKKVYRKTRRANDPNFKLSCSLRTRLGMALRAQLAGKKTSAVRDLGCTVAELMGHLGSKFTEDMTWDNYGQWHIDHILPLCSFDLTDIDQQRAAVHYTNLQPLWAIDNLKKGGR